ncbi:MAG: DNA polymerase III subunit delta' [Nevskia sp.]|nr:DNA polymerase III subunit delta' [Nevskia sp.]
MSAAAGAAAAGIEAIEPLRLLPWQRVTWQRVSEIAARDRLAHALLICGPRGSGKQQFARVLAAALFCRARDAAGLPCGQCGDCRQVASGSHPGYMAVSPEEGKRDIAVEAVRGLCERLSMTSHDGRAKVAVIDPADDLNLNGVNALLKTVEEPPPGSHVLLISERPMALRATLRSRCQLLRLPLPPRAEALGWLAQAAGPGVAQTKLDAALDSANGAPLQALQLLRDGGVELQQGWRVLLDGLGAGGDPVGAAAAIGEDQAGPFLRWLFVYVLQLLRNPGRAAVPHHELGRFADELVENLRRLEINAKPQLVLEALLIRWRLLAQRAHS